MRGILGPAARHSFHPQDEHGEKGDVEAEEHEQPGDAGQPLAPANAVVAVLTPVATPLALGPPKLAAKDAVAVAVVADGTPKPQQGVAAPLQAPTTKPADDAKGSDKTAAPADGKPQPASGTADKPSDTQTVTTSPAGHQPAPLTTGAHAADAKAADAAAPPAATAQPQSAAPAQAAAPPAPPQPLPQAAAIPLSGVAIEIAGKALAGKNHFEIRLDPPELGRIEVRLDVDRDGRITSHVIADRRDTLDLLQRDASGLQRAFQDAGLKTSDNGLQFSLRDQSSGQQQQNPSSPNPASAQLVVEDDAPINAMPSSSLARLNGGLDIRV